MSRLILVLAILGFGLIVLVVNNESGQSFGMDNDRFGELVAMLPLAALLSIGILASRRSLGQSLRQLLAWAMIALALVTLYVYRADFQAVGNRVFAGLMPGRAVVVTTSDGGDGVILHKSIGGHFEASVMVDGAPLSMLVDTGATSVALSFEDALRIGIDPNDLTFSRTILTANGRAQAAPIRLKSVALGPILRENVPAMVTEPGKLAQSLLGMSFVETLGSLEMRGDELRLRD